MVERIYKYIEKHELLNINDTVLAAVSGGADSMLLLRALVDLRSKYKLHLAVIHINHGLRGEDAVADADFVAQMCAAWQVPCHVVTKDVAEYAKAQHLSEEAAGHEVRYQAFQEEMARLNADKLSLGHHLNDRAESVMMHILKGCAPAGLAVLPAKQDKIIRPLLSLTKEEILQICAAENIPYCTDATNFEAICLRNKLRLALLPHLRAEYNPNIDRALCQLAEMAAEEEDYFNEQTRNCLKKCARLKEQAAEIDLVLWRGYHATIRRRALQSLWQNLSGRQKLSFAQIAQILKLAEADCGEKKISLPKEWQIIKRYDKLFLQKAQTTEDEDYAYLWQWQEGELALPVGVFKCSLVDEMLAKTNACQEFVDADKLDITLEVRNRRAGDRMRPLGTGEKKVKDILINKKIPRDLRDKVPLVVCDGKIVWLAGIALSEEFKVTAETKHIVRLTFERVK